MAYGVNFEKEFCIENGSVMQDVMIAVMSSYKYFMLMYIWPNLCCANTSTYGMDLFILLAHALHIQCSSIVL